MSNKRRWILTFPISRDPPEGGTAYKFYEQFIPIDEFPISRDPPEGGTTVFLDCVVSEFLEVSNF